MNSKGVPDKAGRVRQHTQELVQEIRTWVELQLELAVVRVWERFEGHLSQLIARLVAALLGYSALVFLMVAVALWLGPVLGHTSLGFLIAGSATGLIAWLFYVVRSSSRSGDHVGHPSADSDQSTS